MNDIWREIEALKRQVQRIPARFSPGGRGGTPIQLAAITANLTAGGCYKAKLRTAATAAIDVTGSTITSAARLGAIGTTEICVINLGEVLGTAHALAGLEQPIPVVSLGVSTAGLTTNLPIYWTGDQVGIADTAYKVLQRGTGASKRLWDWVRAH